MVAQQTVMQRRIYYHKSTTNESFKQMHYFLKSIGIANNKFMLILYDPDLAGVDPYDPRLNYFTKQKILREICTNYFYFIREVIRIPDSGGKPVKYRLDRGNLALNFCLTLNLNIFLELPRQQGKTISAICRYLWLYMFGTTSSEINFLNKRMEDSKLNLARFKEIKEALPTYLQNDQPFDSSGKRIKTPNRVEFIQHPINRNKIRAVPSARNKANAASLLRGRTTPLIWADEYAFIPYNKIIYTNTVPAFETAAKNAASNQAPFGLLITTTPGFLNTDEGKEAFDLKEEATPFNEQWYNKTYAELMDLLSANQQSSFVYIKFTYQQLGVSEEWFKNICKDMRNAWPDIRREVLLEWSDSPENSPFRKEDLDAIGQYIKQPIRQVMFLGKYIVNIYEELNFYYTPIMGVDVSGGYNHDASAISIIDSNSTRLTADFNCNYISPTDLAALVYEIVHKYMPKAVVNVERNGGYGASVLSRLVKSDIKRNLYFEIKDRVIEERAEDNHIYKRTAKTKVYGFDSSHSSRELLIELLRERVEYHKDKIISPYIYDELKKMEVKRNGKVEHGANSHDDSIFSWLMALYVYYEGKDLMNLWGIKKTTIKTDQDLDETIYDIEPEKSDIMKDMEIPTDVADMVHSQLETLSKGKGKMFNEWMMEERKKDTAAMHKLLSTPLGRMAYARAYNEPIENITPTGPTQLPDDVFSTFNSDSDSAEYEFIESKVPNTFF